MIQMQCRDHLVGSKTLLNGKLVRDSAGAGATDKAQIRSNGAGCQNDPAHGIQLFSNSGTAQARSSIFGTGFS
jgi:hypothetical protein